MRGFLIVFFFIFFVGIFTSCEVNNVEIYELFFDLKYIHNPQTQSDFCASLSVFAELGDIATAENIEQFYVVFEEEHLFFRQEDLQLQPSPDGNRTWIGMAHLIMPLSCRVPNGLYEVVLITYDGLTAKRDFVLDVQELEIQEPYTLSFDKQNLVLQSNTPAFSVWVYREKEFQLAFEGEDFLASLEILTTLDEITSNEVLRSKNLISSLSTSIDLLEDSQVLVFYLYIYYSTRGYSLMQGPYLFLDEDVL